MKEGIAALIYAFMYTMNEWMDQVASSVAVKKDGGSKCQLSLLKARLENETGSSEADRGERG